jgi:hypothetical protein
MAALPSSPAVAKTTDGEKANIKTVRDWSAAFDTVAASDPPDLTKLVPYFSVDCAFRLRPTGTMPEYGLDAIAATEKVAVVIDVFNTEFYEVFNTSSERLGCPPLSLAAGERATCDFDVELNLGPGTYYLGVYLYRYDV